MEEIMANSNYYLSPQQAADMLGLSLITIRRHLNSGKIPATKIGNRWRIKRDDIDDLFSIQPIGDRYKRIKG
jgi:excisionase family DNA binding protein